MWRRSCLENNNLLISVIVPIYNVEQYLSECVDSILNQTYTNLEIILVDDGSTDNSGEMCDEYALKDARIVVLHKKNGGLSDARNAGLSIAKGDYIGFVDSDDYIRNDMYEKLYNLCQKYDVKLACARWNFDGKGEFIPPEDSNEEIVLSAKELLINIFSKNTKRFATISVWDRLYHRSVIDGLLFPKGKNYEDQVYSVKAIINAGKCAYLNQTLYYYRVRNGSIMQEKLLIDSKSRMITDCVPLRMEQLEYLEKNDIYQVIPYAKASYYEEFLYWYSISNDDVADSMLIECMNKLQLSFLQIIKLKIKNKIKMRIASKMFFRNYWISKVYKKQ